MALLPPLATLKVGDVLAYGAKKYAPKSWQTIPNLDDRYRAAALRHIMADLSGEALDPESGLPHLAHAATSLMFVLENRLTPKVTS